MYHDLQEIGSGTNDLFVYRLGHYDIENVYRLIIGHYYSRKTGSIPVQVTNITIMLIEIPLKFCNEGNEKEIKYILSSHIVAFKFYENRNRGDHRITDGRDGDYGIHIEYKGCVISLSNGDFIRLNVRCMKGKRKEVDDFEREYLTFLENLHKSLMKLK